MNTLSLELVLQEHDDGRHHWSLMILVDGVTLIEHARRVEAPYAQADGTPSIAGAYGWVPASEATISALASVLEGRRRQRACLAQCTCGVQGCWPLIGSFMRDGDEIVMGEFLQPHRDPGRKADGWRHDGMGPFRFSMGNVEAQINRIDRALHALGTPSPDAEST